MNITYGLTEELYTLGTDIRIAYGIAAYSDANEDGIATIVASVHDVAADKQSLADLVLWCNRLKLSLIHFNDIVEDFLAS